MAINDRDQNGQRINSVSGAASALSVQAKFRFKRMQSSNASSRRDPEEGALRRSPLPKVFITTEVVRELRQRLKRSGNTNDHRLTQIESDIAAIKSSLTRGSSQPRSLIVTEETLQDQRLEEIEKDVKAMKENMAKILQLLMSTQTETRKY